MNEPPTGVRRIPALDGVRGLAILLVMFHHFTIIPPLSAVERGLADVALLGRYGVDLFFVLSGFLITGILIDSRHDPHYFKTFYIRRVLRIFPLYYAVVAFTFLVVPPATPFLPTEAAETVRTYLPQDEWPWHVAFLSNVLTAVRDRFTNGLLAPTWSLAIEEHFYLVWPAVVFATVRSARLRTICLVIIVATLALRTAAWSMGWSRLQIYVLTFTRMDALAFGALIALSLRRSGEAPAWWRRHAGLWCGLSFALLVGLGLTGHLRYTATIMNTIAYTLVGVFAMQLIMLAIPLAGGGAVARFFNNPVLRFFGRYWYAIYLLQLPVRGVLTLLFFTNARMSSPPGALFWQGLLYLAATAGTVAAALVSWHLLEKHMLALKSRVPYAPAYGASSATRSASVAGTTAESLNVERI